MKLTEQISSDEIMGLDSEMRNECAISLPSTVTFVHLDIGSFCETPETPTVLTKLFVGTHTCSSDFMVEIVASLSIRISTVLPLTWTGKNGSSRGLVEI